MKKKIGDVTKKKLLGVTPKDPLSVARLTLESQEEKMEKYARKVDDLAKEIGELTLKGLGNIFGFLDRLSKARRGRH